MAASSRKLRVAVVGVGHLGRHHARILAELPEVELVAVVDRRFDQARTVAARLRCEAYEAIDELPEDLDAAVVAVPTIHHHAVAMRLLERQIHLLVEKPLAATVAEADAIVRRAHAQEVILQVGHVERFNPACEALKLVEPHRPVQLIQCVREVPYSFRSTDIGAVLDLMIHDIDLVLSLTRELPVRVEASAWSSFGGHEDVAVATLMFPCGTVAQCLASRISPHVRREMRIYAPHFDLYLDLFRSRGTVMTATPQLFADLAIFRQPPPDRITELRDSLFERYFSRRELAWPTVLEPLRAELQHFVRCVRSRSTPVVDGTAGRNAVAVAQRILDAARVADTTVPPARAA